jgi:hypothetical protein
MFDDNNDDNDDDGGDYDDDTDKFDGMHKVLLFSEVKNGRAWGGKSN